MISKEMYMLLSQIPRYSDTISYTTINSTDDKHIYHLLAEAAYKDYDFINQHGETIKKSSFSLTEKGQSAIEDYEQAERNQRIVDESLKIAQDSLRVAKVAKWAAIASAVAAFFALIPQLPALISFFSSLHLPVQ